MLIVGIDTATVQVSVAVGGHEGVLAATQSSRGRQHAEVLTPSIEFACKQARIELSEISVVAVDLGPGLFTGFTSRLIVATIDARRGELFYAFYRQVPGGIQRITDHQVGSPDDLASELMASGEECLLVGDGAIRYSEVFDGLKKCEIAEEGFAYPNATSLVMLAHAQALREQWVKPWDLEPMYLRKPDAEINWSTRPGA